MAKDVSSGTNAGGTDRKAYSRVFAPAEVHRSIKRVVEEHLAADSAKLFADAEQNMNHELDRLRQELQSIDPTLASREAREALAAGIRADDAR